MVIFRNNPTIVDRTWKALSLSKKSYDLLNEAVDDLDLPLHLRWQDSRRWDRLAWISLRLGLSLLCGQEAIFLMPFRSPICHLRVRVVLICIHHRSFQLKQYF